jgi:hypothetical protein
MAGITATISVEQFRSDWCDHAPIVQLCELYSITKDQVIRLRDVWQLPLRNDRRLRSKPERQRDPTPAEIEAACLNIQQRWDDRTREARCVNKHQHVTVRHISVSGDILAQAEEPELD